MAGSVANIRTPYVVRYRNAEGEMQSIRRVPPARLHSFEKEDVVTISRKRGDDWDENQEVKVIGVNSRQPNTLMVEGPNGRHTFLSYSDVRGKPKDAGEAALRQDAVERQRDEIGSDYLLWP